jgi:hypothetical protein
MKLHMFRTVRLSIIRSLFIVHSAMVYIVQVCRQLSSRTRMEMQFHPGPARKRATLRLITAALAIIMSLGCCVLLSYCIPLAYAMSWLCHHQTTSYELCDRNSFGGKCTFAGASSPDLEPTHPLIQWLREITRVHLVPTFRTHGAFLYFSLYRHRVTRNNVNAIILFLCPYYSRRHPDNGLSVIYF